MKKLNLKVGFMMALVMSATAFVSCSSDDEDGSNGNGANSKRIVKKTYNSVHYGNEVTTFDYDCETK